MNYDIYGDIVERTNGDIYIGVVGPVRTGKSTFITKFMEETVIPNLDGDKKNVAKTETPQSASGKTVMTTEPKFVPGEAVEITAYGKTARIRLIDCVGYLVDGALGTVEDGADRLVNTPWKTEPVPFKEAAEIGTKKVITDHSTLGVVVTTDGSFTDIKREEYYKREKEVVAELKSLYKPFIVVFNTAKPDAEETKKTCSELQNEYGVTVLPIDVLNAKKDDLEFVLSKVLEEFPMRVIDVDVPKWMSALSYSGEILSETLSKLKTAAQRVCKMKDVDKLESVFDDSGVFEPIGESASDMSTGRVTLKCKAKPDSFYRALKETSGEEVSDEASLIEYVKNLTEAGKNYYKIKDALALAESDGYGVVGADLQGSVVSPPEIVKKSGQYCVRMRVDSKSLHLIRADVTCEVEPVFGSKEQCENFVALMNEEGYDAKVFGRRLDDIVGETLRQKSSELPQNMRGKLKRVVTKAVNEGRTGLIYLLI